MNAFRRCLKEEFGKKKYRHFVALCMEEFSSTNPLEGVALQDKAVYREMYAGIRNLAPEELARKKVRLAAALLEAFQIARQFVFVLVFFLAACVALLAFALHPAVTAYSLGLMTLCFLYKLYEFVSNRFCFVDAYLLMIYKSVLEQCVRLF